MTREKVQRRNQNNNNNNNNNVRLLEVDRPRPIQKCRNDKIQEVIVNMSLNTKVCT